MRFESGHRRGPTNPFNKEGNAIKKAKGTPNHSSVLALIGGAAAATNGKSPMGAVKVEYQKAMMHERYISMKRTVRAQHCCHCGS
jgi:hypothetical protein